jgi:polysaccharide export outer membrane protein
LTAAQAQTTIEQHVSAYVPQAKVNLATVRTVAHTEEQPAGQPSGPALQDAPQVPVAPTRPISPPQRSVIASNWRGTYRPSTRSGPLMPTEWLARGQTSDKPAPVKPMDKPAAEPPAEQLGQPTPVTTVPGPAAMILPPIVGGHHGGEAPRELAKVALPPYVIEPPDILLVEYPAGEGLLQKFPIAGQHLVRPDGTVSLGVYGSAMVAGMTIDQAREVIAQQLQKRVNIDPKDLNVDVLAYNSKFYYVITDGGGYGEQVVRVPFQGSDTVLDAIGQINGLPAVASKKHIWVARRCAHEVGGQRVLPVNWKAITQYGDVGTNYQLMPGDRVYVRADKLIRIDTGLAKVLSPIERIFGVTLLGSQTVNSIRTDPNRFGNNNTR